MIKEYFRLFTESLGPFPKKVKFWTALKWYLGATYFPYDKGNYWRERKRTERKYCTECGWPLIRIDDLYDPPMESIHPEAIQMCQFCGIQYKMYEDSLILGHEKTIYPIWAYYNYFRKVQNE